MQSPESFIVTPKEKKYKSGKKFGDVEFETVTSIENAKDVSKEAIVVALPLNYDGEIEVGDGQQTHIRSTRMRGSSRSRRPSPMRLRPSTVRMIAPPGMSARWGAKLTMVCASASIRPQLGRGGCAPSPT